ncbi:MAG: HEAT repeat domain-containing protein [Planctomycetota bacterium]
MTWITLLLLGPIAANPADENGYRSALVVLSSPESTVQEVSRARRKLTKSFPESRAALYAALQREPRVATFAVNILAKKGKKKSDLLAVRSALQHDAPMVRVAAVKALRKMKGADIAMDHYWNEPYSRVRLAIVDAVRSHDELAEFLLSVLEREKHEQIRSKALALFKTTTGVDYDRTDAREVVRKLTSREQRQLLDAHVQKMRKRERR